MDIATNTELPPDSATNDVDDGPPGWRDEPVKCAEETCEENEGYGCQGHAQVAAPPPAEPEALVNDTVSVVNSTADVVEAPAGPGLLESKRFTRELLCKMDEHERAVFGDRLAAAVVAHDVRKAEVKEEKKALTEEVDALYEEVKRLSRIVTQGGEEREVECMLIRNDREGSIETVRCDTGEVIDRRAQNVEERQLPLRPLQVPDEDLVEEAQAIADDDGDETPEELKGERCAVIVDQERCESPAAAGDLYCQEHIDDGAADEAQCTNFYGGSRCRRPKKEGEEYCAECIADDEAFEKEQEATAPATPAAKAKKKAKKGRRKS